MVNWRGLPLSVPSTRSQLLREGSDTTSREARGQALEPGDSVGEYLIVRLLGEGGFGTVYEARHPVIGKRAAVKLLHAQYSGNEQVSSRFVAEARAVNQIRHKNIVDIFSFGDLPDGRHYYVMELLEGVPLDVYLEHRGRLQPELAWPILLAVGKALDAAHGAGLAHRDLKPENIFLEIDADQFVQPKLLDFGMAKLLDRSAPAQHKTESQSPIGSPRYMSPEQCRGMPVDARTDVYAFGCLTYRMLTGQVPFEAETALEIMMAHVSAPPVPPSRAAEGLIEAFDEPILRMLEKAPEVRPSSVLVACEALRAAAERSGLLLDDGPLRVPPELHELTEQRRRLEAPLPVPRMAAPIRDEGASRSRRSRRRLVLGGVAAGLVGTVIATGALLGDRDSNTSSLSSTPLSMVKPSIPKPAMTPSAPAVPDRVAITVNTLPPTAEIVLGGELLGVAPGPFLIERRDVQTSLEVRAKGYLSKTVTVTPNAEQSLKVALIPAVRKTSTPLTPTDLEDPY